MQFRSSISRTLCWLFLFPATLRAQSTIIGDWGAPFDAEKPAVHMALLKNNIVLYASPGLCFDGSCGTCNDGGCSLLRL